MKRNIKSLLKFFLLSAVTVVFTVLIFRIFKAANPAGFEIAGARRRLILAKGVEPLGPVDVSYFFCHLRTLCEAIFQNALINNEKIDWHDYDQIKREAARTGKILKFYTLYNIMCRYIFILMS